MPGTVIFIFAVSFVSLVTLSVTRRATEAPRPRSNSIRTVPVTPSAIARYRREWDEIQQGFGRFPGLAVAKADDLLGRILDGAGYTPPDPASRLDMFALGVELGWGKRKELKRVFEHYASIIKEALAQVWTDEITVDLTAPDEVNLRAVESEQVRRARTGR